jgi:hypothetical protein
LGIGTALTSGGKYVPEDIRFQTLRVIHEAVAVS